MEVSGWDEHADFFVEKTELLWADFPDQWQHGGGAAGSRDDWRPRKQS